MANILLRSPYYIQDSETGSSYATLELSVGGILRYTITNDSNSSGSALFEISELTRDYLDVIYNGTYNSYVADISIILTFYDSDGIQVGATRNMSHKGFDGYGDFIEGYNPTVDPNMVLQSNTTVYAPKNTSGVIPYEASGAIAYASFGPTSPSLSVSGEIITIRRICDTKYNPIKATFVNKFGALQDVWFDKKNTKSISVTRDMYKSNTRSTNGSYQTYNHVNKSLKALGRERIVLNTGFMCESMNEPIKQLMMSEQSWITLDSNILPVNLTNSDITFKTSLNDKLINYTMEFEYAFDSINNIR